MKPEDMPLGKLLPLDKNERVVPLSEIYELGNLGLKELIPNFIAPKGSVQLQLDWPIGKPPIAKELDVTVCPKCGSDNTVPYDDNLYDFGWVRRLCDGCNSFYKATYEYKAVRVEFEKERK